MNSTFWGFILFFFSRILLLLQHVRTGGEDWGAVVEGAVGGGRRGDAETQDLGAGGCSPSLLPTAPSAVPIPGQRALSRGPCGAPAFPAPIYIFEHILF